MCWDNNYNKNNNSASLDRKLWEKKIILHAADLRKINFTMPLPKQEPINFNMTNPSAGTGSKNYLDLRLCK